jgi:putative ABC transport system permease protein
VRDVHSIGTFVDELRHGARLLWRNPGFAASALLTIALGIGVTTAVFTLVYGVVLQPLPYREPERLVSLWSTAPRMNLPRALVGAANYRDWAALNRSFESLALVRHIGNFNLTGAGEPERVQGARVTASLFPTLGVMPVLGRPFDPREETIGRESVVILSDGLWTRRFGRDPGVIGRTVRLNADPYEIVAVMPPGFAYPSREFELWVPLTVNPEEYRTRLGYNFLSVGRLRPGVSVAQAQAEMNAISAQLAQQYPDSNRDIGAIVESMRSDLVKDVRRPLLTLLAAVGSLLLIGCASLANLLIARAVSRSAELALRSALGATRGRLLRQAITELVPLLAAGGAAGLLLAHLLLSVVRPVLPPTMPRVEQIAIGAPVLIFTVLLLAITAALTALWPAIQVARWDVATALRDSLRGGATTLRGERMRDVLVVLQIAVSVVLLVGSSLLVRSFVTIKRIDPGFDAHRVTTLHLAIPRGKYPTDNHVAAFCRDILERVRQLPGVKAAGMVNRLPLAGGAQIGILEFERSALPDNRIESIDWRTATPDYFEAMGIPLVEGRSFTDADGPDAAMVGIVDEQVAKIAWPNESGIGRRFRIPMPDFPWVTIVGVVGHIRHDSLTSDTRPQVYWPHTQRAQDRMALVVRAAADDPSIVSFVIGRVRSVDPEQPVYDVRTMTAVVDRSLGQQWLMTGVLAVFATMSLFMAAIGVYGVVSYGVRQRAREFSVRMALGADRRHVLFIVLTRGVVMASIGLVLGLGAALLAARGLAPLLHDVSALDPTSFAAAALVLGTATLVATMLPARRAVRAEPMTALRGE